MKNEHNMIISQYDHLNLKIDADDDKLESINDFFTAYVPNHYHMPMFRSGIWDGKVRLFNLSGSTLPYGLLSDLIKHYKKIYPDDIIKITNDIKNIYKGKEITPIYNLNKKPYYYQKDCIETALKYSKGLIRSATASGKSLIISYIIKTLMENDLTKHSLIVVPTVSLVEQFYGDMIDYGLDKNIIGRVYDKYKEFDNTITISTWQSLMRNHRFLPGYDCIIIDEAHQIKSTEITKIAKKATHATYRLGFTGTLPSDKLDLFNIKAYIGPILREYGPGQLSSEGYISKCNINAINFSYSDDFGNDYNEIKQLAFQHKARLRLIFDIANKVDSNILILVGLVEKEGNVLFEYIKSKTNKTVIFLNGKTKIEDREYWRKICEDKKDIILIATYGIFAQGLNIPSLKYVVLGSPFKSEIRVLQSIGRALRLHADKIDGAIIYDIIDNCKYLDVHGKKRLKYYTNEKFIVKEFKISTTDLLMDGEYHLP
jgi:superfamily II DNA or RNA helicase